MTETDTRRSTSSFRVGSIYCLVGIVSSFCWTGTQAGFAFLDEEDKRQDLVPFPRVGRTAFWTTLQDVSSANNDLIGVKRQGLVPFPRVGRETKRQGLIPFPRIGRGGVLWDDPDIDSDIPGDQGETGDNGAGALGSGGIALWLVPYKRNPLTFTPRIGRRKKRSLAQLGQDGQVGHEQNNGNGHRSKTQDAYEGFNKPSLQFLDWVQNGRANEDMASVDHPSMSFGNGIHSRQLIPAPRIGKRGPGETTIHLRSAFVPRLGRKRSDNGQQDYNYQDEDFREDFDEFSSNSNPEESMMFHQGEKRGAFTPRIGRAPFTPRIGRRSDGSVNRVKVHGRAFTPRIGRSSSTSSNRLTSPLMPSSAKQDQQPSSAPQRDRGEINNKNN